MRRPDPSTTLALPCSLLLLILLASQGCGAAGVPRQALEHNQAGAELLAEGELERAEARFRLALEFQPGFAEARMNLGLVALERHRPAEAEAHFRGAIGMREDFGEAWGNLGVALEQLERPSDAQHAYESALSIHPGLVFARRNLSWLLAREGRYTQARAHLLRLREQDPQDADAGGLLAWCELRLDRADAAAEAAAAALAVDPQARSARLVQGLLLARAGDLVGALEVLEPLQADDLLGREATIRVAAIQTLDGQSETALREMERLLRTRPDDAAARLVAASAASQVGRWQRARHHAEAALRLAPRVEAAALILADACLHLEDTACAREALTRIHSREGAVAREALALRARIEPSPSAD